LFDSQTVYHSLGVPAIYQIVCAIIHKSHNIETDRPVAINEIYRLIVAMKFVVRKS
jgi:hypothetical protein